MTNAADPEKSSLSLPREERDIEKSSNLSAPDEAKKNVSGDTTPGPGTHARDDKSDVEEDRGEQGKALEKIMTPNGLVTPVYLSGMALAPVIFALVMSVFVFAIDLTIIGTAIPKITDEFHGLNQVSWYGAAYFMTFGGFQPASGKFFKYFPLKASFIGSMIIFMVGSLICGVAHNSTTFIVGRAIAGVAAAGVATGVFTIVGLEFEPAQRPNYMGLIGGVYGISAVLGPILGGVFTTKVSWRWCFYINLPVGGLSALIMLFFLKDPPQAQPLKASWKEKFLQTDPIGVALIMGAVVCFTLGFQYGGQTKPWSDSSVIGLLVGFGVITIIFILWQIYNQKYAMFQYKVIGQRYMWSGSIFQCFFAAGYFVFLYYVPIYFQSVDNDSAIRSGVLNLPAVLAVVVSNIISGAVTAKTGQAWYFLFIGAFLASIGTGLMYTFDINTTEPKWSGYQFLYGFGAGLGFQMTQNIAQANTKLEDMSSASATILFFQTIGGAFSISGAQAGFINRIVSTLAKIAPEVSPLKVIETGATQIRTAFPEDQVQSVVLAYMAGLKISFIVVIACTCFATVMALFVPMKRLNIAALTGSAAA